jgi:signal transduction histidine kinase
LLGDVTFRTIVPQALGHEAARRRAVLLAVLPAGVVALLGLAAGAFLASRGTLTGVAESTAWWLLLASALVTVVIVVGAGWAAAVHARAVAAREAEKIAAARRAAEAAERELAAVRELAAARRGRVGGESDDSAERFEVFDNLARRLQSLVHREIGLLDDLENQVEDPDLLKGMFQVDHLATRVRRYAENLALLGGAAAHRQWSRPIGVSDVLRSAIAEIEQYWRVKLVLPVEGTVRGHAVADVVHLMAELAENATAFSPPDTRVLLHVQRVTAGLAIEVEDRGLGIPVDERNKLNALLAAPREIALGELLLDGRIGLYVVAALAQRHRISVQLQGNIFGGTQAVLVLPHEVLGEEPQGPKGQKSESAGSPENAPARPEPRPQPQPTQEPARATAPPPAPAAAPAPPPAPAPAPPPAPAPARAAEPATGSAPPLPRRRRQEHLSPELRDADQPSVPEDIEHDTGLLAAFRDGIRQAEQAPGGPTQDASPT